MKIKEAITHFECQATNAAGLNDEHGIKIMKYCDMAIAALKEKQEREKGCEYCLQGEDLVYGLDTMQRTGRIYIDGNLLTADLYSESMAVAVCCCPMCGRKLDNGAYLKNEVSMKVKEKE